MLAMCLCYASLCLIVLIALCVVVCLLVCKCVCFVFART